MNHCYVCKDEITSTNQSDEHIIPNAIGGRLKSQKLLCKPCNSKFGEEGDAKLAKQYLFFMQFLQIKRERGDSPKLSGGVTAKEIEYTFDGLNLTLTHPVFKKNDTGSGIEYYIEARSEKEMMQRLSDIGKKHPGFDVTKAIANTKRIPEVPDPMKYQLQFGGDEALLSIAKTAVNYYLHTGGEREVIAHWIDTLKNGIPTSDVRFYHPHKPLYKKQANEVIHMIHIYADKHKKVLWCYIEFFSLNGFVVILNADYSGKSFSKTYAYELLTNKELNKEVTIKLTRSDLLSLPKTFDAFEEVTNRANRLMDIATRVQDSAKNKKLIEHVYNETIDKMVGPNGKIFQEHITAFTNRLAEEMAKTIDETKRIVAAINEK